MRRIASVMLLMLCSCGPQVDEQTLADAKSWRDFQANMKEIQERHRRENDPKSPDYVDRFAEERKWPVLRPGSNEPENGRCIDYLETYASGREEDGDLVRYYRATPSSPAYGTAEGTRFLVPEWPQNVVRWRYCPDIP